MRPHPVLPRLAREGFVPAGPEKRITKRHMLIPKTGDPTEDIPRLFDFSEVICPAERRALREIVAGADVVHEGKHDYLVARVSPDTLDSLATFETSREDLEDGGDHELVNEDGDDSDLEPSIGVTGFKGVNGVSGVDLEEDTSDLECDYLNAEPH